MILPKSIVNSGFALILFFLTTACSHKEAFSEFHSFPQANWAQEDIAKFEVVITDTIQRYDVFLEVRNNNDYPFRNLWLFVDITTPDGKQRSDTINSELADIYGKWYGKGISLYSYSFPYESNIQYPVSGNYTYSIRQGMRKNPLNGISDIGLTVSKNTD
jgi:gliding motility-associated lipoprotein GldH